MYPLCGYYSIKTLRWQEGRDNKRLQFFNFYIFKAYFACFSLSDEQIIVAGLIFFVKLHHIALKVCFALFGIDPSESVAAADLILEDQCPGAVSRLLHPQVNGETEFCLSRSLPDLFRKEQAGVVSVIEVKAFLYRKALFFP